MHKTILQQQVTIDRLEQENSLLRDRVRDLEHRDELNDASREKLEARIKVLEADNERLRRENEALLKRISELERKDCQ